MVTKNYSRFFSVMFCILTWAGESWRNDLSNGRALLRDNPKQAVCVFFFVWYCFPLSRWLVNRAEIYTHKAAILLLITHINLSFFALLVETTSLSTRLSPDLNKATKYFQPTYFVKKPAFVYAENPDSGKLLHSCFVSTKYASICVNFL